MLPQARHTSRVTRDLHQKFRLGKKISRNVQTSTSPSAYLFFETRLGILLHSERDTHSTVYSKSRLCAWFKAESKIGYFGFDSGTSPPRSTHILAPKIYIPGFCHHGVQYEKEEGKEEGFPGKSCYQPYTRALLTKPRKRN
jgi:hypothetical protein